MVFWKKKKKKKKSFVSTKEDRWKERSKTYQGIADAMAAQWGAVIRDAKM